MARAVRSIYGSRKRFFFSSVGAVFLVAVFAFLATASISPPATTWESSVALGTGTGTATVDTDGQLTLAGSGAGFSATATDEGFIYYQAAPNGNDSRFDLRVKFAALPSAGLSATISLEGPPDYF